MRKSIVTKCVIFLCSLAQSVQPAYQQHASHPLRENSTEVSEPGIYDRAGASYQLTQNISAETSALFLGNNITLDLNGYTIRFADGGYQHVPNYDFEHGLTGWDISNAPSATIVDDKVHVFTGKHMLRLAAGEEIVSDYISLPIAERSYFAMCGVATWDMMVSVFVEDSNGTSVQCFSPSGDSLRQSCPMLNRSPRLGGGFVTAHLFGRPAGRYRVRIRAETDCLIDHVDLRPAMDVGISIIDHTNQRAHNDDLYDGWIPAFFDFTKPDSKTQPLAKIPRVKGPGTITIKNGVIKNEALGVLSWGIQSTARDVKIVLDNVKIMSRGINTNAVDAPSATITNCRFEIDTPFIINRHVSEHAVVLRGPDSSSVSECEFFGGQGCLTIMGKNSDVHDNFFANRQTVTNHYSIMAMGDGSTIHHNMFKPEIGSGVEIFRHKYIRIYDNEFHIKAAPPTCEYGHEEYSTTAIRVADYGAAPGSERGCADNKIYKNRFYITGKDYPEYPDYIPMAWAFFHSVSGGDTYIYDNDIFVNHTAPNSKAEAAAIYIGGSGNGGLWENNRISTNVPAAWIASRYGGAANAVFINNSITLSPDAEKTAKAFRMGWKERQDCVADNIIFDSNEFLNSRFGIDKTDQPHSYAVFWSLTMCVKTPTGEPAVETPITVKNSRGQQVAEKKTDATGQATFRLREFSVRDNTAEYDSPYTLEIGDKILPITLEQNRQINILLD